MNANNNLASETRSGASQPATFASAMAAAKLQQTASEKVPNVFAQAKGLTLSDSDLDAYIDPSVTGNDRAMAKQLMRIMPISDRGDFVYMDLSGHLMSNNPAKLPYVTVTKGIERVSSATPAASTRVASGTMHAMDYSGVLSYEPAT